MSVEHLVALGFKRVTNGVHAKKEEVFDRIAATRETVIPGLEANSSILSRIDGIPSSELQVWFETTLGGLGVVYDQWLRHGGPDQEVTLAIQALTAMWIEMQNRGTPNVI